MAEFSAKAARRKGKHHQGADELFLSGEWKLADFTGDQLQRVTQSLAVLAGGKELQQYARLLAQHQVPENKRHWDQKHRRKQREQTARRAHNPKLPGTCRPRLPESLRALYGASAAAEQSREGVAQRSLEMDAFLQSHHFVACDYCKRGWLSPEHPYLGSAEAKHSVNRLPQTATARRMAFHLMPEDKWGKDDGSRICVSCYEEVQRLGLGDDVRPQESTDANNMDIQETFPELDALTFFEEEVISPIQPLVRVFTLYATGLTEMRGHVANWAQNGPQFVREIPCKAKDLNLLLVRRQSRDPNKPQRVPFIARPAQLTAALDRLEGKLDSPAHLGFRTNALITQGGCTGSVRVARENLAEYRDGQEPAGLNVHEVPQQEEFLMDRALFEKWLAPDMCMELNQLLQMHLAEGVVPLPTTDNEEERTTWLDEAWKHVLQEVVQLAEAALMTAAVNAAQEGEAPDPEPRSAPDGHITHVELTAWLEQILAGQAPAEVKEVLLDEITAIHASESMRHPVEESGMWDPEDGGTKKSEEQLLAELRQELAEQMGSDAAWPPEPEEPAPTAAPAAASAPASEEHTSASAAAEAKAFDTSNMSRKERAALEQYGAARVAGAPFHPMGAPQIHDSKQVIAEDMPHYISLAFLKIFQTGAGDYWAFERQRRERGMPVSMKHWLQHIMQHRSGRALRHPRFFYFAINTLLRNKAVRGKSYFVRQAVGHQAYEHYTAEQLLRMSKTQMSRVLCAYENALPGSAAEKLRQRSDLEGMLNQLEEGSEAKAHEALPAAKEELRQALAVARAAAAAQAGEGSPVETEEERMRQERDLERAQAELGDEAVPAPSPSAAPPAQAFEELRHKTAAHFRLRRCAEQRGEVPVHFITLTTAIYHWQDLAPILERYEEGSRAYRSGRSDPLEPGEQNVPAAKLRVLHYSGVVAWFCALKLELMVRHVLESDDVFAVFEWGSGGIVHLHLLRWLAGKGRYDRQKGGVPAERHRRDAQDMAAEHDAELCEWDLMLPEKYRQTEYDEYIPAKRAQGPLNTSDESDGSGSDSAPSMGEEDPREAQTKELRDDQQWSADGPEDVPPGDVAHLLELEVCCCC